MPLASTKMPLLHNCAVSACSPRCNRLPDDGAEVAETEESRTVADERAVGRAGCARRVGRAAGGAVGVEWRHDRSDWSRCSVGRVG